VLIILSHPHPEVCQPWIYKKLQRFVHRGGAGGWCLIPFVGGLCNRESLLFFLKGKKKPTLVGFVCNFSFFNILSFINIIKFYQLCIMKLTLKIKLLPTIDQAALLLQTMKVTNAACDSISEVAWQEKIFNKFKLHSQVYYPLRSTFELSSQMVIRSIAKVADAYTLDKKTKRTFKPLGAIAYDSRIMTYKPNYVVSLWRPCGSC